MCPISSMLLHCEYEIRTFKYMHIYLIFNLYVNINFPKIQTYKYIIQIRLRIIVFINK